jgi:hypothetical protein
MSYQEPDDLITYITDNNKILDDDEVSNIPIDKIQILIDRLQTEIDAPTVKNEHKTLFTSQREILTTILNKSGPQTTVAQSNDKEVELEKITVSKKRTDKNDGTITCVTMPDKELQKMKGGKRSRSKNAKSKSKSTQKKNKKGSKRQGKYKKNGGRSNKNNQ